MNRDMYLCYFWPRTTVSYLFITCWFCCELNEYYNCGDCMWHIDSLSGNFFSLSSTGSSSMWSDSFRWKFSAENSLTPLKKMLSLFSRIFGLFIFFNVVSLMCGHNSYVLFRGLKFRAASINIFVAIFLRLTTLNK